MLTELIYYLNVLLDQEGEGHHRAERVQNSEVEPVSRKRKRNVGLGRFIPQYRRIKIGRWW